MVIITPRHFSGLYFQFWVFGNFVLPKDQKGEGWQVMDIWMSGHWLDAGSCTFYYSGRCRCSTTTMTYC